MSSKNIKTKKEKKKVNQYSEETLKQALHDIREKKKGIRETCRKYGIPRTTIQDRLSGKRPDMIIPRGPDPFLGVENELKVKEWLLRIAKCGFPIKKQELLDAVQKIIKFSETQSPFKDDRPGQTWYLSFLKRHPDLADLTAERVTTSRAPLSEETIRSWFNQLETFLKETGNEDLLEYPERIFNVAECGFLLCPKTSKVLGPKRNLFTGKPGNEKDTITVLVTANAIAQICPPLLVFPYISPPKALVESMPGDWCVGKSEKGWMSSDLFKEYITNDFNNFVENYCIKKPILLLIDGNKSHMSLTLNTMCSKLGIILYAFPPHSAQILQPLDISVFGSLKSSWWTTVNCFLSKPENVDSCVNKTNFCLFLRDILENTNMSRDIRASFGTCGIYPFNPEAIDYKKVQNDLQKILEKNKSKVVEITKNDIASTIKVLKYLKPTLRQKKINVGVILKELHNLKTAKSTEETTNTQTLQQTHTSTSELLTTTESPVDNNYVNTLKIEFSAF